MLDAATLHGLSIHYLQDGFDNLARTPAFHFEMWEYCCSDYPLVAIAAPRKHAKSTSVTLTYVIGSVVFREHDFIMIVSDTESQAKLFLGNVRKQFVENEKLQAAFGIDPEKPLLVDSMTDLVINFVDGHKAKILAKGSNAKRGPIWDGKRPNLIIADDMENEGLVENPARRKQFRRWLRNSLIQSLSKGGKFRMVGTILHSDSALENYMPESQTPKHLRDEHVVVLPNKIYSTYTGPDRVWYGARYRAHPAINDYSSLLWPENYDEEWYTRKYYEFLSDGDTEGYAQEYLNQPLDETKAFFRGQDMLPMTDEEWGYKKTYYCGVDFAITKQADRDYTVFATVGLGDEGIMYVEDLIRRRIDTYEIVDCFFSVHALHKTITFIIEKGAIWEAVKPVLFKTMSQKGIFFNIIEAGSIKDKRVKARPLQHRLQAKAVRFDKESLWWPECENELKQFDRGKHDDQVDAIGIIPLVLQKLAEGEEYENSTAEELEDEDFEMYDLDDIYELGASTATGY